MENVSDIQRRVIHIFNPAAGKGSLLSEAQEKIKKSGGEIYLTKCKGDAVRFIQEVCDEVRGKGEVHFISHGGDGTVFETVNGIMNADAGKFAMFSVIASGSGNDFIRGAVRDDAYVDSETNGERWLDVISYVNEKNERKYAANMINIGFDCSVVVKAGEMKKKPLVSGSAAYVLGVIQVLIEKKPLNCRIEIENPDGNTDEMHGKYLLCAIGNSLYCGGGFRAMTAAKLDDGLLDVLIVNDIGRIKFASLVGDYRNGIHADKDTGIVSDKFKDTLSYRKCRKISLYGIPQICADGEVEDSVKIDIEAVPHAVRYIASPVF